MVEGAYTLIVVCIVLWTFLYMVKKRLAQLLEMYTDALPKGKNCIILILFCSE